jgi:hypothetical protein
MWFIAHCAVLEMIRALVIDKENPGVERFDVTGDLSRVKQLEYFAHF